MPDLQEQLVEHIKAHEREYRPEILIKERELREAEGNTPEDKRLKPEALYEKAIEKLAKENLTSKVNQIERSYRTSPEFTDDNGKLTDVRGMVEAAKEELARLKPKAEEDKKADKKKNAISEKRLSADDALRVIALEELIANPEGKKEKEAPSKGRLQKAIGILTEAHDLYPDEYDEERLTGNIRALRKANEEGKLTETFDKIKASLRKQGIGIEGDLGKDTPEKSSGQGMADAGHSDEKKTEAAASPTLARAEETKGADSLMQTIAAVMEMMQNLLDGMARSGPNLPLGELEGATMLAKNMGKGARSNASDTPETGELRTPDSPANQRQNTGHTSGIA